MMTNRATCNTCSVRSSCILSALPPEGRAKLTHELRRLRFRPGEVIFHQGVPVAGLYVLCRGHAKLMFRTSSGKRVLIKFCRPGDLLAGITQGEHVVSAVSMGESVVGVIGSGPATALIRRHPDLALKVNRRLERERHMLLGRLAYLTHGSVKERLARGLLALGKHYGVRCGEGLLINLPLSQGDLADLIGASRQKVNLTLRQLVKQGLIRTERGRITILDQNGLQNWGDKFPFNRKSLPHRAFGRCVTKVTPFLSPR